jgi:hypothetical protein
MEIEIGLRLTVVLVLAIVLGALVLAGSRRPPSAP